MHNLITVSIDVGANQIRQLERINNNVIFIHCTSMLCDNGYIEAEIKTLMCKSAQMCGDNKDYITIGDTIQTPYHNINECGGL